MSGGAIVRRAGPALPALLLLIGLLLLGGCAGTPDLGPTPARHQPLEGEATPETPIAIYDPWEGFNRGVYKFNAQFDQYLFLPVVRGYEYVLPIFVQDRVSYFFSNLGEMRTAANGILQLRPEVAGRAVIRFVVNSTFGLLGLFDTAGALGAYQQPEDFGQTLGYYGLGPGPYLMLPVLGPSSVRDAGGLVVDTAAQSTVPPASRVNDLVYRSPLVYGLEAIDRRHINGFRYYGTGSPFEYDLVRFIHTRLREAEIQR